MPCGHQRSERIMHSGDNAAPRDAIYGVSTLAFSTWVALTVSSVNSRDIKATKASALPKNQGIFGDPV